MLPSRFSMTHNNGKPSEICREARFYSLAPAGRRQLSVEKGRWTRLSGSVQRILEEASR